MSSRTRAPSQDLRQQGVLRDNDLQEFMVTRLKSGIVPGICRIEGPVETLSWDAVEKQKLSTLRLHQYLIPDADDKGSPLLIKGAVQHWPALQRWSLEWLAEQFPEQR